jgi:hypothetical protein
MPPRKAKAPRAARRTRAAAHIASASNQGGNATLSDGTLPDQTIDETLPDGTPDEPPAYETPNETHSEESSDETPDETPDDNETPPDGSETPPDGNEAPAGGASSPGQGRKLEGGINTSLQPLSNVREMFEDMVKRLDPAPMREFPFQLNVATICSGTDAPIFALGLIQEALQALGYGAGFEFKHLFSCEIEPFKQGFIRRNLPHGTLIFRDVVELAGAVSAGKA